MKPVNCVVTRLQHTSVYYRTNAKQCKDHLSSTHVDPIYSIVPLIGIIAVWTRVRQSVVMKVRPSGSCPRTDWL